MPEYTFSMARTHSGAACPGANTTAARPLAGARMPDGDGEGGTYSVKTYVCELCGYIYDPAKGDPKNGVPAGTAFEDLADDWVCPDCGAGKEDFSPEG